jgi:hypothetical protein
MRKWRLSTQSRIAQSLLKGSDPHSRLWTSGGERHQYTYALHRSSIRCALAASGHGAPAPPSSTMKSRRDLFQAARPLGSRAILPTPRWRCGRDFRIGQLQGLKGIDQAGAEIVIAFAGREPLCARG